MELETEVARRFTPRVLTHVVAQHADEAAFLWHLRDRACVAPHYNLPDLAYLDGRVEDHIQGLRIAGAEGLSICSENLADDGPGAVFAAAVLAIERVDSDLIAKVGNVVADPSKVRQFTSALAWAARSAGERFCIEHLTASPDSLRACVLRGLALRRIDPGRHLEDAIHDSNESISAAGLRAAGELGRIDLLTAVLGKYGSPSSHISLWAMWAGALLGDEVARRELPRLLPEAPPIVRSLAGRMLNLHTAVTLIEGLAADATTVRLAAIAIGQAGYPDLLPLALQLMDIEEAARVAGEAVYTITGLDFAHERLEAEPPKDFKAGPSEDADDENVELDADENLPWPDKAPIEKWWNQHSEEFQPGVRYLLGQPITDEWLQTVLACGKQRQRAGAALQLTIRHPGRYLFNACAPGFRQQRLLGIIR